MPENEDYLYPQEFYEVFTDIKTILNDEDFATEEKLEQVRSLLSSIESNSATETTLGNLLTAFNEEDFASEEKLEAVRVLLNSLDGKDFATESTLDTRLANVEAKIDTILDTIDEDGNIKTKQSGRIVEEPETIIDAQSVDGNSETGWFTVEHKNCNFLWLLISIDKTPWTAYTTRPWSSYRDTEFLYPERKGETSNGTTINPAQSLLLIAKPDISSMSEAYNYKGVWDNIQINIANDSEEVATVTAKVLRSY